jgi:hypothetical protein
MSRPLCRNLSMALAMVALITPSLNATALPLASCLPSFTADGTAKVHDGTPAKLSAASACQFIDSPNPSNVANVHNVNQAAFFGFSDWAAVPGVSELDGTASVGTSGTWAIPAAYLDFGNYDYLLVFKSGGATNLIGFLLDGFTDGGWSTPFTRANFGWTGNPEQHDVSHLSLFWRPHASVPEPGTLALMGAGLIGLLWVRRRKQRADKYANQIERRGSPEPTANRIPDVM